MNRTCSCGGRLVPTPGDRFFAFFRCDKCGDQRKQRKRQPKEGEEIVVLSWATRFSDGHTAKVYAEFEKLPDWAKDIVRPRWNHPAGCECHDCWINSEGRR